MKLIEEIGYTRADLIKMSEGKKDLPTGITHMGNGRKGYRIGRTLKGKDYRFGSFQNLEHAIKTNHYIDRLLVDVRKELEGRPLTEGDLETAIHTLHVWNSRSNEQLMNEIRTNQLYITELADKVNKKSFWKRIFGR